MDYHVEILKSCLGFLPRPKDHLFLHMLHVTEKATLSDGNIVPWIIAFVLLHVYMLSNDGQFFPSLTHIASLKPVTVLASLSCGHISSHLQWLQQDSFILQYFNLSLLFITAYQVIKHFPFWGLIMSDERKNKSFSTF